MRIMSLATFAAIIAVIALVAGTASARPCPKHTPECSQIKQAGGSDSGGG